MILTRWNFYGFLYLINYNNSINKFRLAVNIKNNRVVKNGKA
jgi:hypothetical protein